MIKKKKDNRDATEKNDDESNINEYTQRTIETTHSVVTYPTDASNINTSQNNGFDWNTRYFRVKLTKWFLPANQNHKVRKTAITWNLNVVKFKFQVLHETGLENVLGVRS